MEAREVVKPKDINPNLEKGEMKQDGEDFHIGIDLICVPFNFTTRTQNLNEKAIKQAQQLEPTNRFYYLLAAQLYRLENNLQAASEEYEAMIRNTTNYRDYLLDLADLYVALENYDKAIATLNLTEDKFNTPNKFATQKKELLLQAGKEKEAINLFRNLTEKVQKTKSTN